MVQVRVKEGLLEGKEVQSDFGEPFFSFQGIPFAAPPIGDLRFKAPQPPTPWSGIRSAKEHGPICRQIIMETQSPVGSEDCLYLNVYTPNLTPSQPLPVMLYIHGGGYIIGSGNDDSFSAEYLVKHDVILVTINYRLDIFGFLCLDTEDVPGNAGMKDQVAAMRWVKENIYQFGGDPDNITIFGESAGAASVTFHLISPMTKGLFKRAIAQSGAATCSWGYMYEPRKKALAIARKLGFYSEDDKELYEFFKSLPTESLTGVKAPMMLTETIKQELLISIGPVSEKKFGDNERFFYGDVLDAFRHNTHEGVDVITGYNEDEGLMGLFPSGQDDFKTLIEQANNFPEIFVPTPIVHHNSVSDQLEVGTQFRKYYVKNELLTINNIEKLAKFYSYNLFVYGVMKFLKTVASKNTNKLFLYKFTCKSERNFTGHILGLGKVIGNKTVVCHGDDCTYLFPTNINKQVIKTDSKTFEFIDRMTKLWTNFAKFGNPTPDGSLGAIWSPYTLDNQAYMDIGQVLVPGTAPDNEELEFWEGINSKYLPDKSL